MSYTQTKAESSSERTGIAIRLMVSNLTIKTYKGAKKEEEMLSLDRIDTRGNKEKSQNLVVKAGSDRHESC